MANLNGEKGWLDNEFRLSGHAIDTSAHEQSRPPVRSIAYTTNKARQLGYDDSDGLWRAKCGVNFVPSLLASVPLMYWSSAELKSIALGPEIRSSVATSAVISGSALEVDA